MNFSIEYALFLFLCTDLNFFFISFFFFLIVLERPSSQMSYLEQFLKENNQLQVQSQTYDNVPPLLYQGGSIESEEGDIEDNRALSLTSSKSNLSELSMVRFFLFIVIRNLIVFF